MSQYLFFECRISIYNGILWRTTLVHFFFVSSPRKLTGVLYEVLSFISALEMVPSESWKMSWTNTYAHHCILYVPRKISYHIWIDDLIYSSPWKSFHKLIESPVNYNCHDKSHNSSYCEAGWFEKTIWIIIKFQIFKKPENIHTL